MKWVKRIAILLLLAAAAYAVRVTWLTPQPVEVDVISVGRGIVESTVTNSKAGTVRTRRRARLSPETGGRVVELPFREGDQVSQGAVVLRLDDSAQRAQLVKARRDLTTSEAQHRQSCLAAEQAGRELVRHEALAERQIVSQRLLDQLRSEQATATAGCEAAAAAVESSRAAIAVIETEFRKTVLKAPFDGIVAELSIELGEWTTPSPPALPVPPVIELIDPRANYISAPMDEVDSAKVALRQAVRVTVDSHAGQSFSGSVARVAPYVLDVEAQNRTVEIEVDLDDQELAGSLLPGTSADVEVILDIREEVLRIPTATLIEGQAVLLVEGGLLVRREVEVGVRNWDFTEILGGLQPGDRIVTSLDRPEIQPGAEVVVAGEGS